MSQLTLPQVLRFYLQYYWEGQNAFEKLQIGEQHQYGQTLAKQQGYLVGTKRYELFSSGFYSVMGTYGTNADKVITSKVVRQPYRAGYYFVDGKIKKIAGSIYASTSATGSSLRIRSRATKALQAGTTTSTSPMDYIPDTCAFCVPEADSPVQVALEAMEGRKQANAPIIPFVPAMMSNAWNTE